MPVRAKQALPWWILVKDLMLDEGQKEGARPVPIQACDGCFCADTTGTPTRINRVHGVDVSAVPVGGNACIEKMTANVHAQKQSVVEIKPNLANILFS